MDNPFSSKLTGGLYESSYSYILVDGSTPSSPTDPNIADLLHFERIPENHSQTHVNGNSSAMEEEDEDLLADFIDEDSQLPSRISKPKLAKNSATNWHDEEVSSQTGSSICLLK